MNEDEILVIEEELPEDLEDTQEALIVQGAIDAIEGTESYAVKYLGGCMIGAGMLPYTLHGQEGVWETIKSGFNKTISYIKNFFMGIWNYFFGKEDKVDEEITKSESALKTALKALPSGSEITEAAQNAVHKAAETVSGAAKHAYESVQKLAGEYDLVNKLKALSEKLKESANKLAEKGKDMARINAAAAIVYAASLKDVYFSEVKPKITGELKAAAEKTKALIASLEAQAKTAVDGAKEEITKKLNELKEAMKAYASIKSMKSSIGNFVKGALDKLKPSYFAKKA